MSGNPFGSGLNFLKNNNSGSGRTTANGSSANSSGSTFIFRPSKLSGKADELWQQRKHEAEKLTTSEEEKQTTGEEENKKDEDSPFLYSSSESTGLTTSISTSSAVSSEASGVHTTGSPFVFGSRIEDRVTESAGPKSSETDSSTAEPVAFEELAKRAKEKSESEKKEKEKDESEAETEQRPGSSAGTSFAKESEFAVAHPIVEEVEVKTGEEEERNLLHANAKLHIFKGAESSWHERGQGMLRINEKDTETDGTETRLVMRLQGSLRVILNCKLWPEMVLQRANPRRIRFSALDPDTNEICVYLLSLGQSDADSAWKVLETRLERLKATDAPKRKAEDDADTDDVSAPKATKKGE